MSPEVMVPAHASAHVQSKTWGESDPGKLKTLVSVLPTQICARQAETQQCCLLLQLNPTPSLWLLSEEQGQTFPDEIRDK